MIKGIYGINIAVRDLEQATQNYEKAFGVKSEPVGRSGFAFSWFTRASLVSGGGYPREGGAPFVGTGNV